MTFRVRLQANQYTRCQSVNIARSPSFAIIILTALGSFMAQGQTQYFRPGD